MPLGVEPSQQISIHALREEGDCPPALSQHHLPISIHALREEGDLVMQQVSQQSFISIHALREEGDPNRGYDYSL